MAHLRLLINRKMKIDEQIVEVIKSFKYFGCLLNDEMNSDKEIRTRIEQSRSVF